MVVRELAIAHLSAVPPGEGRAFEVRGTRIAVFHTRAGEVFAVQAECPHKYGPLADGLVGGTTVICPLHQRKFDLASGAEVTGGGASDDCPLKTYPVRLGEDRQIWMTLG